MKFSKSINKNSITNAARNNRQKAIGYLWGLETELSSSAANIVTGLEDADLVTDQSKHEICEMLQGHAVQVNVLYEHLLATYQRGVIPVLLAVALQPVRRRLIIRRGQSSLPFSPELWEKIDLTPEEYSLELMTVSETQQKLIEALEMIFGDFIVEDEKKINSYTYLQNAMQRFVIDQPKYVQVTNDLAPTAAKLRNAWMNFEYAPHYLIFDLLPSILGENPIAELKNSVRQLQEVMPNFYRHCREKIEFIFPNGMIQWARDLHSIMKHRLFDHHEERVLSRILQADVLTDTLISDMAVLLTGLSLENFETATEKLFFTRVKDFKDTVEGQPENGTRYLLCQMDEAENIQKSNTFCGQPYTDEYGKMFYHELHTIMQEYDRSVPLPVRRQVLVNLLTEERYNALL